MSLERDIVRLDGRTLPTERIILGGGKFGNPGDQVDWTRDLRGNALLHPVELNQWTIIVTGRFKKDALAFVDFLKRASSGMKFRVANPEM